MIRPFTLVCCLLACGSGLYLYQSKHRVQVLDREIEQTVRATIALREQTRILFAEATKQGDPQRLQALADQFLALKTVTPGQFTSMADLDSRLPAVRPPEPPPAAPQLVAVAPPPQEEMPPPPPATPAVAPPAAPRPIAVSTPPRPPEHRPPPPRPAVAEVPRPTPVAPRPVVAELVRAPAQAAPLPAPAPAVGSALGMARSVSAPPPRPMPVSASQWVTNGGGG